MFWSESDPSKIHQKPQLYQWAILQVHPKCLNLMDLGYVGQKSIILCNSTTAEPSTAVDDAIRAVTKSLEPCRCFRQPTCSPLHHCIFTCAKRSPFELCDSGAQFLLPLGQSYSRVFQSDIGLKKIVLQHRSGKHCLSLLWCDYTLAATSQCEAWSVEAGKLMCGF